MDNLTKNMNDTYHRFLVRNPLFQGTVGIMAHSLGGALVWELLAHQPPSQNGPESLQLANGPVLDVEQLPDDPQLLKDIIAELQSKVQQTSVALVEERRMSQPLENVLTSNNSQFRNIVTQELSFKVDKFFMVGSPAALFLILRGVDPSQGLPLGSKQVEKLFPGSSQWGLPNVGRLYNIYHPYDPVAYRMEPLVSEYFDNKQPVFVPYYKGGKRFHIGMQAMVDKLSWKKRSQSESSLIKVEEVKGPEESKLYDIIGGRYEEGQDEDSTRGRIDFVVQETPMESPLVSVIMSHFGYWQHLDVLMFIVKVMQGKYDEHECQDSNLLLL
eukprot:TRINITY_DN17414_c0_g1_i2.p1 TRINITY_DN17414_c0_g1~~TRINITY_DN17414_c0_g1_i2.p1  ORF type:complete len:328 (-),score=51.78 TRINITY_DN17414_c0_g1_i2:218-1201(-)